MALRGRHVGIPQHARDLFDPRLTHHHRHIARRNAALPALGHHEVLVGIDGDLRQVRDDESLPAFAGYLLERFPDPPAHLAADALIDFVEHERRDDIVGGEHDLEREHESRELAARGHPSQWTRFHPLVQLHLEDDVLSTMRVVRGAWLQLR